ncbi:MAG: N-acetyl-gamma-glutamyl-phosphate reductase [Nitrospirota bacterium]
MQKKLRIAIAGATGYTGGELIRLLVHHPEVTVTCATSDQSVGKPLTSRLPSLKGYCDLILDPFEPGLIAEKSDIIFSALSHTKAMKPIRQWINQGKKVIDLSADYRLKSAETYEKFYHAPHQEPELLKEAVYGLSEIYRDAIQKASLIANPGCYPTGALLPIYPFFKSDVVDTTREIIIDAKSGISGAGRAPTDATHFPEVNEGLVAYNIGTHRHIPEIEQGIKAFDANISQGSYPSQGSHPIFTPYLLPVSRGILTTIYLPLKQSHSQEQLENILHNRYNNEYFIRLLDHSPNLRDIRGSNFCDIAVFSTKGSKTAILISAIDNLVKGASGQAIQNMNIMMGWNEQEGLMSPPLFP